MASSLPPGLLVRPATHADLDALGRFGARLMRVHYGFDPQRFMVPAADAADGSARFLGSQLRDDESCIFVAARGVDVVDSGPQ